MPKINVAETHPAAPQTWRSSGRRGGAGWLSVLWRAGIAALVACAPAATARAQGEETVNPGVALKSACRADYRAHCVGNDPAAPIAAACLAQFYINLSKGCQAALDAYNTPQSAPTESAPTEQE